MRRLSPAFRAWLLWALILVLAGVSFLLRTTNHVQLDDFLPPAEAVYMTLFWMVVVPLGPPAYATVGAIIVARRPRNLIGWLALLLALLVVLEDINWGLMGRLWGTTQVNASPLAISVAWMSTWMEVLLFPPLPFTLILLTFPSGRLLSRGWGMSAGATILGTALRIAAATIQPVLYVGPEQEIPNPTGIPGSEGLASLLANAGMGLAFLGTAFAVLAMVVRWRRSHGSERQQLKWLAFPSLLLLPVIALGVAGAGLPASVHFTGIAQVAGAAILSIGVPLVLGAAMLKHHLFDIDRLINRTLVYTLLTLSLLLLYSGSVVLLQNGLQQITGQASELAVVVSTLGIAALFTPLHRRIQDAIDRRFYRTRYDAVKTLAEFSEILRSEVALDSLQVQLVSAVDQCFQPAHCSIWLRQPAGEE